MQRSGVTPAALGAGYAVFFTYSAVIGVFALMLPPAVVRRQEREEGSVEPAGSVTDVAP